MTSFQLDQIKKGTLGNDAGWLLTFHRGITSDPTGLPQLSSSEYYASIDATLPEGLAAGSYKITVEQLTDAHYAMLRTRASDDPLFCKLYLFWRDANTSARAYFTNMLGVNARPSPVEMHQSLVAVLRVKKIRRTTGQRGYDTELTCVEEVYARLSQRIRTPIEGNNFTEALRTIRQRTEVEFAHWEANPDGTMTHARGEAGGDERVVLGAGLTYAAGVERIANAIEQGRNLYGRKMVLIRDGTVHIGKRPIPYPEGDPKELTLASGLLESVEGGEESTDPYADTESGATRPPRRTIWNLTLKGRPDLKPGDVVKFEPPADDESKTLPKVGEALLGSFAAPFLPSMGGLTGNAKLLYVRSVRHLQSRSAGFATQVQGVVITSAATAWDTWADATPAGTSPASSSSSSGVAAAEAVRRVARASRLEARSLEIGEVRAVATNASGAVEPPAQTATVWEGLVRPDGRPNGVRRLPVRREEPAPLNGVSYLTPFAWGGCGLVLPRYPGTRVALAYRNGAADDPVDVGAVWPSGHAPRSEPGDWWLSLPVGVGKRSSLQPSETVDDHTGDVVHDLTDGDGHRVIEVGELTIRVGQLHGRDQRPARASGQESPEGSVTIEHTGGAKIVLDQNGNILIKGKSINLDAGTGDITMKAKKVDVQVTDFMEVK
ncbi:hypothetical protein [Micromonospora sonneratiae]|uniref:Phage late control gene D protein (GPD) n=1 Tax=Micromonospora sonneratiae TaxID=1184706 RepID=A0ABW3YAC5_9ACTN